MGETGSRYPARHFPFLCAPLLTNVLHSHLSIYLLSVVPSIMYILVGSGARLLVPTKLTPRICPRLMYLCGYSFSLSSLSWTYKYTNTLHGYLTSIYIVTSRALVDYQYSCHIAQPFALEAVSKTGPSKSKNASVPRVGERNSHQVEGVKSLRCSTYHAASFVTLCGLCHNIHLVDKNKNTERPIFCATSTISTLKAAS